MYPIITIDGPSGVGKGTLSRKLACVLGWNLLDSGIIYRLLASVALDYRVNIYNEEKLLNILHCDVQIEFIRNQDQFIIYCNKKKVKNYIYTEVIGNVASKIAVFPKIRACLLNYQRSFCMAPGLVADGRDMGTVVFPNAIIKIFLYASLKSRIKRRLEQLQKKNFNVNLEHSLLQIRERDQRDNNRKTAPLEPAIDALILDSTYLSEVEVENKVWIYIKKRLI